MARNKTNTVRQLQRTLYYKAKQDKADLTYRSKGRGFGWKKYPNKRLYAMGIIYIGSGLIRYQSAPAHAL
jgi:RNA-directed DNA polymerase